MANTTSDLRNALEGIVEATIGLDAPHISRARDLAQRLLDETAGFDVQKWREACEFLHFSGKRRDTFGTPAQDRMDRGAWALQDGYGQPGYTPAQGWDWSGIRDSSPEAKARMISAVEKEVGSL